MIWRLSILVWTVGCGTSIAVDGVDARPSDDGRETADTASAADVVVGSDAPADAVVDAPAPAEAWGRVLDNVTVTALGPGTSETVALAGRAGPSSSLGIKPGLFVVTASTTGLGTELLAWEHSGGSIDAVVGGPDPVVVVRGPASGAVPIACIGAPGGTYHFYPPKSCAWGHSITPMTSPGLPKLAAVFEATNAGLFAFFSSALFKVDWSTTTGGNEVNVAVDGALTRSIDDRAGVLALCRDGKATLIAYVNSAGDLRVRRLDLSATDVVVASSAGTRADLEGRVGLACDASGQVLAFRPTPGTSIKGKGSAAGDVVVIPLVAGKVGEPSWSRLPPPVSREAVRVAGGPGKAVFSAEFVGSGDLEGVPVSAGPVPTIGATVIAEVGATAKLRAVFPASIVGLRVVKEHVIVAGPLERSMKVDGVDLAPVGPWSAFVLGLRL